MSAVDLKPNHSALRAGTGADMVMTFKPGSAMQPFELAMKELNGLRTKVGWFESAKYPNGTPVAYVAAIQENGYAAGGIPPRRTIGPTISAQGAAWRTLAGQGAAAAAKGAISAHDAMEGLGLQASGDVRKAIAQLTTPKLKASTLAARQARGNSSQKPLVDSSLLVDTVTHIVEGGK